MTTTLGRPTALSLPTPAALPGELLDTVTVQDGIAWLDPANLFESYNCLTTRALATFPCPVTTLAAPVSSASSTSASGGTLPADTYRAKITAVNGRGETVGSTEQSQATTGSASTVTFNWAAVSGATGYRVYLTDGAANSEAVYVADTASPYILTAWPPAGAVAATPPAANTAVVPVVKDLSDTSTWIDGAQFAVYGGTTCKGPGYSGSEGRSELTAAFLRQESVGVEQGVMTNLLATAASDDLTPAGGAVTPAVGLALLEGDAAAKYNGVPTIHAPRTVGSLLASTGAGINVEGQKFFSKQGSKVASGGGYDGAANLGPDGDAPAAGEMWMYATGEVIVGRGELVEPPAEVNRLTNDVLLLVERMYIAAIDCYQAAVRVEVYS